MILIRNSNPEVADLNASDLTLVVPVLSSSSSSIPGSLKGQRVFVGHRARGGRGPGLGTNHEEATGPPLDGVRLHSDSNGYGSDTEEGLCEERRRGAKEPHHGLQVHHDTATCILFTSPV